MVELAGDDAKIASEECFGEDAGAWSDFENYVVGYWVGGVDEFIDEVVIDKEILA